MEQIICDDGLTFNFCELWKYYELLIYDIVNRKMKHRISSKAITELQREFIKYFCMQYVRL